MTSLTCLDGKTNRFDESLKLLNELIKNKFLENSHFIVWPTKGDQLKDRLENMPLNAHFPQFDGGNDVDKGSFFELKNFSQKNFFL